MKIKEIKVKSTTMPKQLAGSIMHSLNEDQQVILTGIGAGATNAMVKGCAVAISVYEAQDRILATRPFFSNDIVNDKQITVMKMEIKEVISW